MNDPMGIHLEEGGRKFTADHLVIEGERWTLQAVGNALAERAALHKQVNDQRESLRKQNSRYVEFQHHVQSAIAEAVSNGDLEKDVANEMLDGLGLDRLETEYRIDVTVSATLLVTSTLNIDEVEGAMRDVEVRFEGGGYGEGMELADEEVTEFRVDSVTEA